MRWLAAALVLVSLTGLAYEKGLFSKLLGGSPSADAAVSANGSPQSRLANAIKGAAGAAGNAISKATNTAKPENAVDADAANAPAANDAENSEQARKSLVSEKSNRSAKAEDQNGRDVAAGAAENAADASEDGYEPPTLVKSVNAVAPPEATQDFVTGNVKLDALVDVSGKVSDAKVVSGPAVLHGAAIEALKHYQYKPATKNGRAVPGHVAVTVKFWYEP
jgi:protein TonB